MRDSVLVPLVKCTETEKNAGGERYKLNNKPPIIVHVLRHNLAEYELPTAEKSAEDTQTEVSVVLEGPNHGSLKKSLTQKRNQRCLERVIR